MNRSLLVERSGNFFYAAITHPKEDIHEGKRILFYGGIQHWFGVVSFKECLIKEDE